MAAVVSEISDIVAGKGIVPKSGDSFISARWLASENDLANDPFYNASNLLKPTPAQPTVRTLRSNVAPKRVKKEDRDWDVVTPPGSPTHFDEFCSLADIVPRSEGKERYPLLNPSTPGFQVVPFRGVGEHACIERLRQFEEMERQKLGIPLSKINLLEELQDSHDWNVMERILYDQKKWEKEEYKRQLAARGGIPPPAAAEEKEEVKARPKQSSELILLEMIEDFDMDLKSNGDLLSCDLECHITAETQLVQQREVALWLEKLFLLEECKLHPRVDQQAFKAEQVFRFMPDTKHVIELCNFKVLRSVKEGLRPPIRVVPQFLFDDGVCKIHIVVTISEGHAEDVDITFPMPDAMIAAPQLICTDDPSTAVYGRTTKLCRWQILRLEKQATLRGTVPLHPMTPLPASGPILKLKFEVIGVGVSGVTVAAVETKSDVQPRIVLRHVIRSVDSTCASRIGRLSAAGVEDPHPHVAASVPAPLPPAPAPQPTPASTPAAPTPVTPSAGPAARPQARGAPVFV